MKSKIKNIIFYFGLWSLVFSLCGCDAFVRKFTRKAKKDNLPKEEMVLAPEEYKPTQDKEELYRQYFLFWKSWVDELSTALAHNTSHKRQVSCAEEAIKSLLNLKTLLNEEAQKKLDIYINGMKEIEASVSADLYGNYNNSVIRSVEQSRRNILRDFSYQKAKGLLLK